MTSSNNKRIAKNTMMLYFRMLLTMGVSLYTVRVVLDTLGTVDYGLYNVVGGVVAMFAFLSGTMASASQRFFAFELGRNNPEQLKKTFSMTMNIYILIGVIILALAETIGLWFLNNKMTIPPERMDAAHWVYQFSILSFMMTMFTIPYNAAIIAHEEMKIYAWVSILEVILRLLIVYLLVVFSFDKLQLYAILVFAITTLITFIYRLYCKRKFEECTYSFYWNQRLFSEIATYSGWNLLGSMASIFKNQGVNIILNLFFDPVVNAARAIAYQLYTRINQFVTNFFTAVNPQLVKYYAAKEKEKMFDLIFKSAKLAFFLLFLITTPIILNTHFILTIWLKEVPPYVVLFTRLVLINALIDSLAMPLITSALATGRIKWYQITVGGTMLLNLPLSYVLLQNGLPAVTPFYVGIAIAIVNLFLRLILLRNMIQLPLKDFINKVILRAVFVSSVVYGIALIYLNYHPETDNLLSFVTTLLAGFVLSLATIYTIGLTQTDRSLITNLVNKKLNLSNKTKTSLSN